MFLYLLLRRPYRGPRWRRPRQAAFTVRRGTATYRFGWIAACLLGTGMATWFMIKFAIYLVLAELVALWIIGRAFWTLTVKTYRRYA